MSVKKPLPEKSFAGVAVLIFHQFTSVGSRNISRRDLLQFAPKYAGSLMVDLHNHIDLGN